MKKLLITLTMILSFSFIGSNYVQAQNIQININLNKQPDWGPTGYDYVNYYYFPDINCYYDINNSLFYYLNKGTWQSNRYLPSSYSRYDLYSLYKVPVNEYSPWNNNSKHRTQYAQYKNNRNQPVIRNSNDSRYKESKKNTVNWVNSNSSNNKQSNKTNQSKNNTSSKNNIQVKDNSHSRNTNDSNKNTRKKETNKKDSNKSSKTKSDNKNNQKR